MEQGLPSEGLMASCKLQEQILIQLFPSGPLSGGQEDVTPDVLVHDAAASRHTAEGHIDVFIELNGHLQLTFHCRMLLKRQVLTTSPTARSIRMSRLLAMPRISSFLLPLNLDPRERDRE